ncbi:Homeobox-leucine zipper protein ATHB-22 [Glycine soja]
MEAKQQALAERSSPMEKMNYRNQEKKKQLTSDQLKARKQFVNQMRLQLALNSFTYREGFVPKHVPRNDGKHPTKKELLVVGVMTTFGWIKNLEEILQKHFKFILVYKCQHDYLCVQAVTLIIWFQNRCGRWKNKQLEHLYDSLQQEFNVISKEKQKLKQEVG